MVIQALIADDEALARRKLRDFLSSDPDVEIVGEAATGPETVHLVRERSPQVVFLDVAMPGQNGFDVLSELSASEAEGQLPRIVFTTAYDNYALRAFDARAVDYLLKPFTAERLQLALQRAREEILTSTRQHSANAEEQSTYLTRIIFKSRGRILFIRTPEIHWIGAEENYVRICTGRESHLLRETISSLEERLDPQMFLRVHRSAIVNLRFVKEVRAQTRGDSAVILTSGQKITMSRGYYSRIRATFKAS
ncbi:MAG TPA: LytTR family DNA-binding domain-containing protein [Terracidiphilus sp.]|nr:LytTR family DNA-binding domain-containing protein [Terracidiphilus sp.]